MARPSIGHDEAVRPPLAAEESLCLRQSGVRNLGHGNVGKPLLKNGMGMGIHPLVERVEAVGLAGARDRERRNAEAHRHVGIGRGAFVGGRGSVRPEGRRRDLHDVLLSAGYYLFRVA